MKTDTNLLLLKPKSMKQIIDLMYMSSKYEFSTFKPGNVGPNQMVDGVSESDYSNISKMIKNFTIRYFQLESDNMILTMGKYIIGSVKTMINNPPYKNLLLGHILLFTPLIFSSYELLKKKNHDKDISWNEFWENVDLIIKSSSIEDGILLSRAINLSKAGGLEKPGGKELKTKYNIQSLDIEEKILKDKKNMLDLFRESAEFDNISLQFTTNFKYCREFIVKNFLSSTSNLGLLHTNDLVIFIFLKILAEKPDSLIYRKNNVETAKHIQDFAKKIQENGSITTSKGKRLIDELNKKIMLSEGKLNPGTTADLTACIIFIGLLFNLIEKS